MLDVIIQAITPLSESVVKLTFTDPANRLLPAFEAGAHIDIRISDAITRQYSLCSSPSDRYAYSVAVLRDPNSRGGSAAIHTTFHPGQRIKVSPPKNLFALNPEDTKTVLVAGGIGITPIMSMAHALAEQGKEFTLLYVSKPGQRVAFDTELQHGIFVDRVRILQPDNREQVKAWFTQNIGEYGAQSGLYTCGPNSFMDAVLSIANTLNWPANALHQERFGLEKVDTRSDKAFELFLKRSGLTIPVKASQTALEALDDAGIEVDASCEQGVCGTCLLNVLDGEVDHRDAYLTEQEKSQHNQFTPCCSRAVSASLTLDL
ncbi:oxidoreductase [Aestuariibacter sp. GS-14]|uniref:PDR/VanB family oxidoreductase n=1 Tax=Aestuariibacter sp. GS-14 TaxID=2590670 RepID=UPI0011295C18|nr:PDR/VanB family oxidoreductase [Aestuariibacter sp. GS-14]TPV57248.1 oxidoreductase [Aestuariibacter sp. GS-14]